jgi:glyceraldehyde 3-phosphate dehydrogenase
LSAFFFLSPSLHLFSGIKAEEFGDYFSCDSAHKYDTKDSGLENIEVLDADTIRVTSKYVTNTIKLFRERDPKNIPWKAAGVKYLFDATGAFLTTEKSAGHDVDHVINTAPPSGDPSMKTLLFGVNHEEYTGQKTVSASSCTTNCLAPMLYLLEKHYKVKSASFTTIHATTGSQNVVDVKFTGKNRTHRSMVNNMIPHKTGASKSVFEVVPSLKGKVTGTSLRIPLINCSLVDCNVTLEDPTVNLEVLEKTIRADPHFGTVYDVNTKMRVSGDFLTSMTPTIFDRPHDVVR